MRLGRFWLTSFRNYESAALEPAPDGLTLIVGANGHGKTNLLEAIAYLATLRSFRGVPDDALVAAGEDHAVIRAEAERDGRELLLEVELRVEGRNRFQVNRQPLRRSRDLLGALRVSVFSPDDLALVKGGPAERRRFLDDVLVALHPRNDALQAEVDRIVRQRTTLLKQAAGRLTADIEATLDVWDAKLADSGNRLADARADVVARLEPAAGKAYGQVAGGVSGVEAGYLRSWEGALSHALAQARAEDVRRGTTTVGPHRDELRLSIGGLAARTHASQGEQRSLAVALRLAAHGVVEEVTGSPPVLLLDDVFSELDDDRSEALVGNLPTGQALLTTAGKVPAGARPALTVRVENGRIGA